MKDRIKIKLHLNSMKGRLLTSLIITCILLISVVAYVSFRAFKETLISEISMNRSDVLNQIGDRVKQIKNNSYTLSNLYYYENELHEHILDYHNTSTEESKLALENYLDKLTSQFQNSFSESIMKFNVILNMENGYGYSSEPVPEDYEYMNPTNKIWYKKLLFAKGEVIDVANYHDKQSNEDYFCIARCILDNDGNPIAYLIININERYINSMYKNVISNVGNIYVVDETGTIISSSIQKLIGFNYFNMSYLDVLFGDKVYTITEFKNNKKLFTKYYDETSKFTVLEEISLAQLMAPINRVQPLIVFITIIVIIIIIGIIIQITYRTAKPISKLCEFMMQVDENNLDKECTVEGFTEINILSQGLNVMLARMKELLVSIKNKEEQKHKLELGFLQAQINPHFMYNTLFSIRCMVDMHKNEEASQMLNSFISLLRSTLSNPDEFVSIKDEFNMLEQYAEIQRFRYEENFTVYFECSEEAKDKKIPRLLIQPLLENAIYHGMKLKKSNGIITVAAGLVDQSEKLIIIVEDNGDGISAEIIDKIKKGEKFGDKTHVGVFNVKERIQLIYGKQYGINIDSIPWKGTKITLSLPSIN